MLPVKTKSRRTKSAYANTKNIHKHNLYPKQELSSSCMRWATVTTIDMGRKLGGGGFDLFLTAAAPFWGGGAGSPSKTKSPGPRPTSIPSGILIDQSHLATTDMGRKLGLWPFGQGRWVPCILQLAQCGLGRGLLPYQVAYSYMQPFGHTRHGPKIGGFRPLGKGELGPHLTQCRLG